MIIKECKGSLMKIVNKVVTKEAKQEARGLSSVDAGALKLLCDGLDAICGVGWWREWGSVMGVNRIRICIHHKGSLHDHTDVLKKVADLRISQAEDATSQILSLALAKTLRGVVAWVVSKDWIL